MSLINSPLANYILSEYTLFALAGIVYPALAETQGRLNSRTTIETSQLFNTFKCRLGTRREVIYHTKSHFLLLFKLIIYKWNSFSVLNTLEIQ